MQDTLRHFLKLESASGIILMFAAFLALVVANTSLDIYYYALIDTKVHIQVGKLVLDKPLLLWINDGLMAIFFFLVGLELKRELVEGHLSKPVNLILPAACAFGGMLFPALIYVYFNYPNGTELNGWAVPTATDIAFAMGILALLGSKVPAQLKLFLVSLAIIDDIGAIAIIALFYTDNISMVALVISSFCISLLAYLNWRHVSSTSSYILIGIVLWVALLKSGVHATLAGVIIAFFIPMTSKENKDVSPLKELEHNLHSPVAFAILPIFAFANAGINLSGVGLEDLTHSVPLGIMLGLIVGKQVGVFGMAWLVIKSGLVKMPEGCNWILIYGISVLCGVGFTMSLFIGSLAFETADISKIFDERLGILIGSLIASVWGYIVIKFGLSKT